MKILVTLLCGVSLFAATVLANSIHTIQLRHRPADEVMPVIKPLLGADDSLTGQGYQLFIRTSEENFEQVRQMISQLDTAAKLLLISVFQGNDRELRALGVSGNLQVQDSNTGISLGSRDKTAKRGANVNYSTRNASAGAHTYSTRGRLSDNPVHQLRISEGSEGYIETGEQIPYFSGAAIRDALSVIRRRSPSSEVTIFPTPVQGEEAVDRIPESLRREMKDLLRADFREVRRL